MYDFEISKEYAIDYGNIRLSRNQIKKMLYQNLQCIQQITLQTSDETKQFLTKEEIIEIILTKVHRREVIELIHMISLIKNRHSNVSDYLQYILMGIFAENE